MITINQTRLKFSRFSFILISPRLDPSLMASLITKDCYSLRAPDTTSAEPFARLHCDRRGLRRDRNPLALLFHVHAGEPPLRAHALPVLRPFLDYASDHQRGISIHAYV